MSVLGFIVVALIIGLIGYEVLKHSDRLAEIEAAIARLKSKLP